MIVKHWRQPDFSRPDSGKLKEIKTIFKEVYPSNEYGDLAAKISRYWISRLENIWAEKAKDIKEKDIEYNTQDPLSRIEQKTVLISYADSVREDEEATLVSLEKFLKSHFPAIRGLHILPPCEISDKRFNDGGFSQITRDRIHPPYGTNEQFEVIMKKHYSMTDFVLNHVDIENPKFQQYLHGDDRAGDCFFVFSEEEYQERSARGDFEQIFRPRPFPLFTIYRRKPRGAFAVHSHDQRISILNQKFVKQGLKPLANEVINLLYIFYKIKNDQMLLEKEYQYIIKFREYLSNTTPLNPNKLFVVSETQETQSTPYIFNADIQTLEDFFSAILPSIGGFTEQAKAYAEIWEVNDRELFGEQIRGLTTFSHVQVDLNVSTYEGLKLLIDDFSWYLKMDLNMLRLDAANFAFKKWGTSCFGLPEVRKLLKIFYLSMDSVSPRMVPNLEVNAPLGAILKQMADKLAPPPMMYDFHLPSMLPVVFNLEDLRPLLEISNMIRSYDIPHESIRFSLDESHDGKSVNGSGGADPLLTYEQRKTLIDIVQRNGGYVKYKNSPKRQYPFEEFRKVCRESGLDVGAAAKALFKSSAQGPDILKLKDTILNSADIAQALKSEIDTLESDAALNFFVEKIITGKEPYELCISTRDVLTKLENPALEAKRYLAFKTLAFALMGRNVKAIFFNDLMGLKNDDELVKRTGELRNIKRTKSDRKTLDRLIRDPSHIEHWISKHMNNTIALVDSDPSFHPKGNEARLDLHPGLQSVAIIHNSYKDHNTLVVINIACVTHEVQIHLSDYGLSDQENLIDNISGMPILNHLQKDTIRLEIKPYGRFWIKNEKVEIAMDSLVEVGPEDAMNTALAK